jgi:hypothetical protein
MRNLIYFDNWPCPAILGFDATPSPVGIRHRKAVSLLARCPDPIDPDQILHYHLHPHNRTDSETDTIHEEKSITIMQNLHRPLCSGLGEPSGGNALMLQYYEDDLGTTDLVGTGTRFVGSRHERLITDLQSHIQQHVPASNEDVAIMQIADLHGLPPLAGILSDESTLVVMKEDYFDALKSVQVCSKIRRFTICPIRPNVSRVRFEWTRKGLFWLLAGGISYTAGCYFFIAEKPFWPAIFHFFIMVGTFCHVMAIGKYT